MVAGAGGTGYVLTVPMHVIKVVGLSMTGEPVARFDQCSGWLLLPRPRADYGSDIAAPAAGWSPDCGGRLRFVVLLGTWPSAFLRMRANAVVVGVSNSRLRNSSRRTHLLL